MLAVRVASAAETDAEAATAMAREATGEWRPSLRVAWADSAYRGQLAMTLRDELGWRLDIVTRRDVAPTVAPGPPGFQVLKHRWIVERTFAWMSRFRRASKDYEHLESSSRAWFLVAATTLMLARAARPPPGAPA